MVTRREVAVRLRAEVTDFKREIAGGGKALDDLAKKAGGAEKVAQTSLGRMAQSAQLQRDSWDRVGTTMLGVSAAIGAVGTAALTTGISYNTLQQQSRAALESILGSAEAANAQMDKLDEFARTSPFSKSTFISAQQQMLAFGIEAEKVVPILDAVQNAVAAAGGSNADIEGIVATLSKISSTGKVTAEDLNELGNRGVDAATLIGSQMGMTGAQIREEITAGTLGASEAIDALTAGMSERFDGAAAGVKDTFVGAVDRVKAAWRDLSSELAAPLVGPEGGGLGVAALNGLADAMRQFQNAPDWVKGTTAALGGLTGAAALGGGALLVGLPRYIEFKNSLAELSEISPRAAGAIGKVTGALKTAAGLAVTIGATAVATGALVDSLTGHDVALGANALKEAIEGIAESGGYIGDLEGQFDNFGMVLGMSRNNADSLKDAFDQMLAPSTTDRIASFFDDIPGVTGYMEQLEDRVSGLDEALAAMVAAGDVEAVEAFRSKLEEMGYSTEDLATLLPATEDALIGVDDAAGSAGGAMEGLASDIDLSTEAADRHIVSLEELFELQREGANTNLSAAEAQANWAQQTMDNAEAVRQLNGYVDEAGNKVEGLGTAVKNGGAELDLFTEAGQLANSTLIDTANKHWDNIAAMEAADASTEDLKAATQTARDEFIETAIQMGLNEGAARAMADEYGLVPEKIVTEAELRKAQAERDLAALKEKLNSLPDPVISISTVGYSQTYAYLQNIQSLANSLRSNPVRVATGAGGAGGVTFADGGPVSGPGTSTSDSIPARLSNGEYVIKADAVRQYGRSFFDAVNAQRFASGGYVGSSPSVSVGSPEVAVYVQASPDAGWVRSQARVVVGEANRAEALAGRPTP